MRLGKIYDRWEKFKEEGRFGKKEIEQIEKLKKKILKMKLANPEKTREMVMQMIDIMQEHISSITSHVKEKLILPSVSELEKESEDISAILNRIYIEENKDDNDKDEEKK